MWLPACKCPRDVLGLHLWHWMILGLLWLYMIASSMLSLYYHQMNQQINFVQWRRVCITQTGVAVLDSWHLASTAKVNALLTCINTKDTVPWSTQTYSWGCTAENLVVTAGSGGVLLNTCFISTSPWRVEHFIYGVVMESTVQVCQSVGWHKRLLIVWDKRNFLW